MKEELVKVEAQSELMGPRVDGLESIPMLLTHRRRWPEPKQLHPLDQAGCSSDRAVHRREKGENTGVMVRVNGNHE